MKRTGVSDEEFVALWNRIGEPQKLADAIGCQVRAVYRRRNNIEKKLGIIMPIANPSNDRSGRARLNLDKIGHRTLLEIKGGMAVIFSDAHFWPGDQSPAYDALLRFLKKHKKDIKLVVCNGDAFDGAAISRHPATEWAQVPDVADELAACQEKLGNIERIIPDDVPLIWTMGNHDTRFSARLAQQAPQYVRVLGTDLPDHFPAWDHCWSLEINGHTMVKHRWHNGVHATWNNALKGGRNVFTGHIHRLAITPITDWNGRRYGVDTGTLSDFGPHIQKFTYGEDNPYNWASGFAVATFDQDGMLLPPELVTVIKGVAYWRGALL